MSDISRFEQMVDNEKKKRDNARQIKIDTHYRAINEIISKISAYKDRIVKILDMWNIIKEKDPDIYRKYRDRFSSNGINHNFGFMSGDTGLGCYGGGCLGDYDFEFTKDGNIFFDKEPHQNENGCYTCPDKRLLGPSFTTICAYKFPESFESFESSFYGIIEREYKAS